MMGARAPWRLLRSARELRLLLDDVADINWRHPAWWAVVGATAALEPARDRPTTTKRSLEQDYLASDGAPRADTYVARDVVRADPAERIARAVVLARHAADVLGDLDGLLPNQPLVCHLARSGDSHRRVRLNGAARRAAFATRAGVFTARLGCDESADIALAGALARVQATGVASGAALVRIDPDDTAPTPAIVAVSLLTERPGTARHLHRRAWTTGGGPWLGIGHSPALELFTTCHMVVDGYGHVRIATESFDRTDAVATGHLAAVAGAARAALGPQNDERAVPGVAGAEELGVATSVISGHVGFAHLVYATGRALEQSYHGPVNAGARFSPTFQIPIAPGNRDDPGRLLRRVVPGLFALRKSGSKFESLAELRERLAGFVAREAAGAGPLTQMMAAATAAPVPRPWLRRALSSSSQTSPWFPPVLVLAGRGCLSTMRFPAADRPTQPIYAASSPALSPSPNDPLGGTVLTVVHHTGGLAATVSGTGIAGNHAGARRFLDRWLEELQSTGGISHTPRVQ